jgi:solute:Na+ symporter, SSS family
VAIADGIQATSTYGANAALPALFLKEFPAWFSGFAFAAIAIGAVVPAAIMSIASANLFTRNIYREYFRPDCTDREESNVAKMSSLVVKIGALIFIVVLPNKLAINFQLLGGIWIIQTLPPVFLGLYTHWFHRRALLIGLIAGLIAGTWMCFTNNLASVYPITFGPVVIPTYIAVAALLINVIICVVLTPIFRSIGISAGEDATRPNDYEARPVLGSQKPTDRTPPPQPSPPQRPAVPSQAQPHFETQQPVR